MSHAPAAPKPHGLVAEFLGPGALIEAAKKTRAAGYKKIDAYSPFPVHGLAEAVEFEDPRLQWLIFIGGVVGALVGLGLQAWVSVVDYPVNVGGKPMLSLPAFVPVLFECTVLAASFAAVFGMLGLNGLPRPHHPVFSVPGFDRASQDRFFLVVEAVDPQYDSHETADFLQSLGAESVHEVEDEE